MLKILYNFISSPKIFVYTVLWLMILVFFGTLAQKDIGLYASQMKYFSSSNIRLLTITYLVSVSIYILIL